MSALTIECSCDPEDIARAVWHEFHHVRSMEPYSDDDDRLSCGYCNSDNWYPVDGEKTAWRMAFEARLKRRDMERKA